MSKEIPNYKPEIFETGWQAAWEEAGIHKANDSGQKPKFYCLDYFPYPSGEGLHVGHCRNYVPTDVISRYKRMRGYNVLHPMGWDAFGEPAEQHAIKNGVMPRITTDRNTANYKRQMRMIGTSYDWSREIDSSDPNYYRWTQWMFNKMFQQGLAYRDTNWQWFCPTCGTTLSRNEIVGEKCWRGHPGVSKVEIPAWFFKITAYADELITGLDELDWPDSVKRMQQNWIGRSEGVEVCFQVCGAPEWVIKTYTTRPDTLFGVTFLALAPENPLVEDLTVIDLKGAMDTYVQESIRLSEIKRSAVTGEVNGVFTGSYALHPVTQESIPVFVADYVLPSYGGGSIMGVPAHDDRDYQFAQQFDLPVRQVIVSQEMVGIGNNDSPLNGAFTEPGVIVNSGLYNGYSSQFGGEMITKYLEDTGQGCRRIHYRMRDWLISRQRYWGTPIPIVYCDVCGQVPVREDALPVLLPEMENIEPDGSGLSPLSRVPGFVKTECPVCGGLAQRETDTMGGFACSSWYFLRFSSPDYHEGPFSSGAIQYWLPVDMYVGGTEHAVLHLLYARFWTKVLADIGVIHIREPFTRLVNQGQLHGPDGQRMSKSRGNVIIPDDLVDLYGADTLRVHGLYLAPFEQRVNWSTDGIKGAHRFLNRVWSLYQNHWNELVGIDKQQENDNDLALSLNRIIKIVTERIEFLRFNTMISALMVFVNELYEHVQVNQWRTMAFKDCMETLMVLLAPTAPHLAEELWTQTGHPFSVHQQEWPEWDENLIKEDKVRVAIQVNGRVRGKMSVGISASEKEALESARKIPGIMRYVNHYVISRVVYVPGKILNIITGSLLVSKGNLDEKKNQIW